MTNKEAIGDVSIPAEDSIQERHSSPAEASTPPRDRKGLEKDKNVNSEG